MKYSVITFGCRVNQADSLTVEEGLRTQGAVAAAPDEADIVVVNTCSVRPAPISRRAKPSGVSRESIQPLGLSSPAATRPGAPTRWPACLA